MYPQEKKTELNKKIAKLLGFNDYKRELENIADGDCTCSDNPNNELRRCEPCEATGVLNEIAEIARCGLREINDAKNE